jgi:Short C-terminal domain
MFGRMKDSVRGTAQLVSYEETSFRNEFDTTIVAQVIVQGEGIQPTAVESRISVPNSQLPLSPGDSWDVVFERDDPKQFKTVEPDEQQAAANHAAAQQEAQRLAEQMRAGGAPAFPAAGGMAAPQVIDMSGGAADPERVAAAMAKVQEMFGVDMSGAAAGYSGSADSGPAAAPPAAGDDTLDRLERLDELRRNGTLTEAEFELQKQRILGGS